MAPGLKSIEDQIADMAIRWPLLKLVERTERSAIWIGPIKPSAVEYQVRVEYEVPHVIEVYTVHQIQPSVQVLSPLLEAHPDFKDGPVPHVYVNKEEPHLPYLCLFDTYNNEWSPADLLADTIIPWTAGYLYFYEGWLATERWFGPGRHPTAEERAMN